MIYELTSPLDGDLIPEEYLFERMRLHRDRLLKESDWTQLPDSPVDREAWATYRQQLRDFPSTWAPGPTAEFPKPPT
jgi:hypothetical protein